jgi:hypothetical protein
MWPGLDPELRKALNSIRELVALRYQSPTKECQLVFVEEFEALLVIREWPGGAITAYTMSTRSGEIQEDGVDR